VFVAALALAAGASTARAEQIALKHVLTIYDGGPLGKETPLNGPDGVACGDDGTVVVSDSGNGRILRYTLKNGVLAPAAEQKLAQVTYPAHLELDAKGDVLVLDRKARRIARTNATGFVGFVEVKGVPAPDRVVPGTFRVDGAGNLYVLDIAGRKLLVLDPGGQVTRQLALPPGKVFFTDFCVDATGAIFALDGVGAAIWSAAKDATAFAPLTKDMFEYMHFPAAIATNNKGTLFVVDQNGNGIVQFGSDGSYRGRQLAFGAAERLVQYPSQLCMNHAGEAFLADRNNNRVQVFSMAK
jgi:hypothetical protein